MRVPVLPVRPRSRTTGARAPQLTTTGRTPAACKKIRKFIRVNDPIPGISRRQQLFDGWVGSRAGTRELLHRDL